MATTEGEINAPDPEPVGWYPLVPAGVDFTGTRGFCAEVLTGLPVAGAAVTVRGGRDVKVLLHATDAVIARLVDLQLVLGEGPCRDAYRLRVPVLEPDLASAAATARWPMFSREASAAGAAAVFAFPLQIGGAPFGVLELYGKVAGRLTGEQLAAARMLVDTGARLVLIDADGAGLASTADDPDPAFGRNEIPIATGMIAVQLGIGAAAALFELKTAAFTLNRSITDIADDVLTGQLTLTPPGQVGS